MQSRIRACILLFATLALLSSTEATQTCTQKFADLKNCTMFNGEFATGDAASLILTKLFDGLVMTAYDSSKDITKNDECRALWATMACMSAVNSPESKAAAPCNSKGGRLKLCKGLCVQSGKKCTKATDAEIDKQCTDQSAPAGEECFGDNGVLGMKSAAHTSIPPMFAVGFLALAAWLGM